METEFSVMLKELTRARGWECFGPIRMINLPQVQFVQELEVRGLCEMAL